jgi:hypothetical protein
MRIALSIILAACAAPAATGPSSRIERPPAAAQNVSVPPFGDVAIDDGAIVLMDHNTGDGHVHSITIARDLHASKTSWDDKPGSRAGVHTEDVTIDADERAKIQSWSTQLWQKAPAGKRTAPASPSSDYEWAIVMRRGDDVRVLQPPDEILEGITDWLDMHF